MNYLKHVPPTTGGEDGWSAKRKHIPLFTPTRHVSMDNKSKKELPLETKNTQNHENRRLCLIESLHMQHYSLPTPQVTQPVLQSGPQKVSVYQATNTLMHRIFMIKMNDPYFIC